MCHSCHRRSCCAPGRWKVHGRRAQRSSGRTWQQPVRLAVAAVTVTAHAVLPVCLRASCRQPQLCLRWGLIIGFNTLSLLFVFAAEGASGPVQLRFTCCSMQAIRVVSPALSLTSQSSCLACSCSPTSHTQQVDPTQGGVIIPLYFTTYRTPGSLVVGTTSSGLVLYGRTFGSSTCFKWGYSSNITLVKVGCAWCQMLTFVWHAHC